MTKPDFTLTTRQVDVVARPPVTVVDATGEVDSTNAATFELALRQVEGPRPLVTDLSRLDYIDSAGFAALDRLLADETLTIVLDGHSPIHAAAKLMNLPSYESVAAALAAV